MEMHMDIIIYTNIKKTTQNMIMYQLAHGKKGKINIFLFFSILKKSNKKLKKLNRLELQLSTLKWNDGVFPNSICSDPCPIGHVRNYQVN